MPGWIAGFLIAACFVGGRVTAPPGESPAGIRLVVAGSATTAGITDADGYYALELPDSIGAEVLVEFWRGDRFLASYVLRCDRPRTLALGDDYRLETVRVNAPALELSWEGEAVRVEPIAPDAAREAAAALPSVAEAVQQEPGVGAAGRDGFTSSPTIRGLGRGRSLILLEGMRLSADRGVGPSASFLDPLLVGKLELVRGTAGVAYGSGAIGGAILVGLESPTDSLRRAARVSGATNGDGRAASARVSGPLGNGWRASGSGFLRGQDDYRFPAGDDLASGDAVNSGFRNGGGVLVLTRDGAALDWRFTLLGTAARDVGRSTTIARRFDTITEEDHWFGSAAVAAGPGPWRVTANAGFHRPRTVNVSDRRDADGFPTRITSTENVSSDASLTGRVERPAGETTWLAGFDTFARWNVDAVEDRRDFAAGEVTKHIVTDLVADARRADVGVYAGWRRGLPRGGEAMLTGRVDVASRSAVDRPSASWVAPSLDARAVIPVASRWAAVAGLGRAFRAPRIQELYFAGDRPGGSRLANPDLEPETAWAAEAGLRFDDGPWSGRFTGWGLLASDLIVQLPVDAAGDTLRHENVSEGRLFGVEFGARWTAPHARATVDVAYAFVHGDDEHGSPLPDIPAGEVRLRAGARMLGTEAAPRLAARVSLRAGAAKTPPAGDASARWWSDLLGSTKIGGDELGHPGFARWDAGLRWTPLAAAAVDLSVTNVLDSRYMDRAEADAWPEPGRSAVVEVSLDW